MGTGEEIEPQIRKNQKVIDIFIQDMLVFKYCRRSVVHTEVCIRWKRAGE